MSFDTDLVFYPESALSALLDQSRGYRLPEGWTERLAGAMTYTEEVRPGRPHTFNVLTKLRKQVFNTPELVDIRGSQVTIRAFGESRSSGVVSRIENLYIVILPGGALDELDRIAART